ncbi:MAG TPA: DUF4198 domain-containing protein [Thermoanaerobaculia bacterium]|jgi:uncharacterized GH25 family protein|nr:DUF4198 domain-containing protein [Thermoanaerobaculia bacterium]
MRTAGPFVFAALLGLVSPALRAHDFWIEPSTFTPAAGQRVAFRLRVGQELRGDPLPRDPNLMQRFVSFGPAGETPVVGRAYMEPAGILTFPSSGLDVIVYDSGRSPLALEAAKFEDYLEQEGLEKISALRAGQGQSGAPGKEVFSRCAKTLLAVGGGAAGGYDQVVGQRLELVPEANPYALAGGGELPVRLLYQGKPLAGALVVAVQKDRPQAKVAARTDAKGRVRLKLDRPGFWLVKAVHMVPAPRDVDADWESFWASLTFQVAGL